MKTMKTKIIEILNYTQKQYDMLLMGLYLSWCAKHAYSTNHLQILLSDNTVYNWYLMEHAKCEKRFLYMAKPYINKVPLAFLRNSYDEYVSDIEFYPKAVLDYILHKAKINALNPIHNNPKAIHLN